MWVGVKLCRRAEDYDYETEQMRKQFAADTPAQFDFVLVLVIIIIFF